MLKRRVTVSTRPATVTITVVVAVASMVFTSNRVFGQVTTIDFEDFAAPTTVTTQYGAQGVLFNSAYLDTDPAARSGSRVLRAGDPGTEFHTGPLVVEFTSGQQRVRLFANPTQSSAAVNGTLRAFDGDNNLVGRHGPIEVAPNAFTTEFEISASAAVIRRIELQMDSTVFEAIDDLEFEGEAAAPLPTEPPVVQIDFPEANAELDGQTITVQGTVTGDGLFPTARLILESGLPPDSLAPPLDVPLPLMGMGTTRSFASPLGTVLGPQTLTIEARNTADLTASATVQFTNLPQAIRDRHSAEGGSATFGELVYGSVSVSCFFAVYDQGAIFAEDGTTFVVLGDIFDKWFGLRDQGAFIGELGCPTEEERDAPGGARAQSFDNGRIYAGLPTGVHYVPFVFSNAIDELGGEERTGVPISDPTDSSGVMQTWLFQQFTRPDYPQLMPSTLEIRGAPPVLFVERQAGDLFGGLFDFLPVVPRLPTITERFPCDDLLGPCQVEAPVPGDTIENAGTRFCNGYTYPFGCKDLAGVESGIPTGACRDPETGQPVLEVSGPPEWVAIEGDYVQTPALGIVTAFGSASTDNPLAHECMDADLLGFLSLVVGGIECALDFLGLDTGCFPCDLKIDLLPLAPFRNLLAENTRLEIEWEHWWSAAFFSASALTQPLPGDLVFTSGRWIIDCGHPSYNSEIHPPSVLVSMRTETHNGRPATRANIWVNGVYSGDPVEFEIVPPPRPSPDALLVWEKPTDETAAMDVNVEYFHPSLGPFNSVGVRFTADHREVTVVNDGAVPTGEMKWQAGRWYYGVWYVSWSPD